MGSNYTNKTQLLWGARAETEGNLYATYAYTNAFVFRTCPNNSTTTQEVHLIIAGSNYFGGDSTYDSAPLGSIGINKSGGSDTTLYTVTSAGLWGALLMGTPA